MGVTRKANATPPLAMRANTTKNVNLFAQITLMIAVSDMLGLVFRRFPLAAYTLLISKSSCQHTLCNCAGMIRASFDRPEQTIDKASTPAMVHYCSAEAAE